MNDLASDFRALLPALAVPRVITSPAPWAGHTPFAMWLVTNHKPGVLVELGTYSGISYLALCQSIEAGALNTRCFAVDTWGGDEHAGFYGEHIYQTLRSNHDPYYTAFSTLLRKTFDEAVSDFADGSIDLLHIDGLHTYDAVRHDFETWLPKLSARAIVLFHDIEVRRDDFGVWRFWSEVQKSYPSLSFAHSHGLGVLFVGPDSLSSLLSLGLDPRKPDSVMHVQKVFAALGAAQEYRAQLHSVTHEWQQSQASLDEARALMVQGKNLQLEAEQLRSQAASDAQHLVQLQHSLSDALSTSAQLQHTAATQLRTIHRHEQTLMARDRALALRTKQYGELDAALHKTLDRRLKRGLLTVKRQLHPAVITRRMVKVGHRSRNALRYLVRGDFSTLRERAKGLWRERQFSKMVAAGPGSGQVGILTTPHTLYVAHAVANALARAGLSCHTVTEDVASDFAHDFYIVLCAQMFTHLPPGEKRIVFQMEQTVSDRWFDARYLSLLENSRAVFDYSLANLAYLAERKIAYPHVFHVPLGAVADYANLQGVHPAASQTAQGAAPVDVLFYGDPNAPRRKQYIAALEAAHNVRAISNLFGAELQAAIASAQVVVNIHYYEGALLESTRIFECLSLGCQVVSETAADVNDYPGLHNAVHFVPVGDIAAMVQAVGDVLQKNKNPSDAAIKAHRCYLQATQNRFEFMLYRALLAQRLITFEQLRQLTVAPEGDSYALSLPETLERRAAYLAAPAAGAQVFDGLRARPGWIGCAMSYKFLCGSAWEQGLDQLMVCEDDVQLPANYDEVMAGIRAHLQATAGQWDIFVGIIAHLHPSTTVLDVQERHGLTFVTLDKMTSMVFNIYSRRAMHVISQWDETNEDDQTNTIDRYLESTQNLRTVTLLEPLFGHREDLKSSLWGFGNEQYNDYIEKSRAQLRDKVAAFRAQTAR